MIQPIVLIDSGIGGLSILKPIQTMLPNENILYLGDTANMPYGQKSTKAIQQLTKRMIQYVLKYHPKLIIPACNTISSCLEPNIPIPTINILAVTLRQIPKDCIIVATPKTNSSLNWYRKISCPTLASTIEHQLDIDNAINTELNILNFYDSLVLLGCTHYALITNRLQSKFPKHTFITQGNIVAQYTKHLLAKLHLENQDPGGNTTCLFTGRNNAERYLESLNIKSELYRIKGGK